ncbi:MAG: hypothetical protein U9M94_01745 [Patescibacteria group bacterium]|nr:hypothetical protein [Patescibacteria group bacterium]
MQNKLQKAIDLVNKTGDRLLVADMSDPERVFAVMSIDEYEKLMFDKSGVRNLTENELLDKINRDIAIWKSDNEFNGNKQKNSIQARKYLSNIKDKNVFLDNFDFENNPDFYDDESSYAEASADKDDEYGFDDENLEDNGIYESIETGLKKEQENNKTKNPWAIPVTRKKAAEEIIDEDTQYLEEIR